MKEVLYCRNLILNTVCICRYLDYGEEKWMGKVLNLLDNMNTYQEETKRGFKHVIGMILAL